MPARRRRNLEPDSLGGRLRQKRRELGMTQEQLAERADTTQAVIQKIENGKSLRPRKTDKLADALGVKAAWLMFGSDRFDSVEAEAMEIASAWSRLDEALREKLRAKILTAS